MSDVDVKNEMSGVMHFVNKQGKDLVLFYIYYIKMPKWDCFILLLKLFITNLLYTWTKPCYMIVIYCYILSFNCDKSSNKILI